MEYPRLHRKNIPDYIKIISKIIYMEYPRLHRKNIPDYIKIISKII